MSSKVLFVHDFEFKIENEKLYTAVGLPEIYFDRFLEAGFDRVDILSRYDDYDLATDIGFVRVKNARINLVRGFSKSYLYILNPKNIYGLFRKLKEYDVIVCSTPSIIGTWVMLINLFQKKTYSVEVAGDYDMFSSKRFGRIFTFLLKYLMPRFIKYAQGATYVTNDLSKKFPNSNCLVASNVNIEKIHYKDELKTELRLKSCIDIGFVGALTKRKGILTLIDFALKLVSKDICNFKIHLIGGHSDDDWYDQVKSLRIERYFVFHGVLGYDDVDSMLKNMDLYVQPSFSEGLPRATIEAMSNGLPVIATSLPGFKELLDADFLFEINNIERMFEIFYRLICSVEIYNIQSNRNSDFSEKFLYNTLHYKRKRFYRNILERSLV